jgi:4a-hydroxytetrahydrobiopterin dehydratase
MPEPSSRLSEDEIADRLRSLPDWEIKDGKLTKAFKFDDFMGAIGFVNRLAPVAESEGHHPDLQVGWGRVVVELTSHDAGGLTAKDFKLASLIDRA